MPEPVAPPVAPARFVMPWGKHKGVPIEAVPDGYLAWALTEADFYGAVKAAIVDEWSRRARRRRSWRPVAKAKWGRRLLDVNGRGHFAVLQRCGGVGLYTVVLYPTVEEAREKRGADCGYDGGPAGCEPAWHCIVDLLALTEIPGAAIE